MAKNSKKSPAKLEKDTEKTAKAKAKAAIKMEKEKLKADAKLAKAKAKEDAKLAKEAEKASKTVDHVITQDDLDSDPELLKKGLKVGDVIKVKAKGKYKIEVSVNDEVSKADTDSISETILQLPVGQLKTKVVIRVSTSKKNVAEFVLFNVKAKRLFTNAMAAQGFEKNAKLILNER